MVAADILHFVLGAAGWMAGCQRQGGCNNAMIQQPLIPTSRERRLQEAYALENWLTETMGWRTDASEVGKIVLADPLIESAGELAQQVTFQFIFDRQHRSTPAQSLSHHHT